MSHTTYTYPQSTRSLTLVDLNQVNEEHESYGDFVKDFPEYSDIVENKLPKALAIAWLLHGGKIFHEGTLEEATGAIIDFIDEVLIAHRTHYAKYQQHRDSNK